MKNRKMNNGLAYIIMIIVTFAIFGACVAGIHFAFPIKNAYTETEVKYLKNNGYLHDNFFEEIGHNVHNAWLNLQDLMKGGE